MTAPLRFDGSDWAWLGGIVGGIAVSGTLFDNRIRDNMQDKGTEDSNELSKLANNGGTVYSLAVLGAFGTA